MNKRDLVSMATDGDIQGLRTSGRKSWINLLPEDTKEALLELRRAYQAGELVTKSGSRWSARAIFEVLLPKANIDPGCRQQTFAKWLGDKI